jgi:hypothetical protein
MAQLEQNGVSASALSARFGHDLSPLRRTIDFTSPIWQEGSPPTVSSQAIQQQAHRDDGKRTRLPENCSCEIVKG